MVASVPLRFRVKGHVGYISLQWKQQQEDRRSIGGRERSWRTQEMQAAIRHAGDETAMSARTLCSCFFGEDDVLGRIVEVNF